MKDYSEKRMKQEGNENCLPKKENMLEKQKMRYKLTFYFYFFISIFLGQNQTEGRRAIGRKSNQM